MVVSEAIMPRQFAFTRAMHMKSGKDFQRAFREGRRARGDILVVVVIENGLDVTRLGLSVGRKIWKSAVRRNRVRRIFRESFRLTREKLPVGLDVILIPASPGLWPQLAPTCAELEKLAHKAYRREARPPRARTSSKKPFAGPRRDSGEGS
jgi:ribonuclease P protein component